MRKALRTLVRALLDPMPPRHELEAERRWRANNAAAKARGCPCGAPATTARCHHGTVGRVPHETWTCGAHADVDGWHTVVGPDGTRVFPLFARPAPCASCPGMCSRMVPADGPPSWLCPQQPERTEQP